MEQSDSLDYVETDKNIHISKTNDMFNCNWKNLWDVLSNIIVQLEINILKEHSQYFIFQTKYIQMFIIAKII